jgi:hypothetical protein
MYDKKNAQSLPISTSPHWGMAMFHGRLPCVGAVLALTALASCSTSRNPIPCSTESECPSASKCVLGYCVAGALPRARIELRTGGALSTHRPIVFEGSSSEDPNPDGAIAAYDWNVKRGPTAHCDPIPAHGSEPTLNTVFTCEGDYEVDLVVQNTLELKSEPASLSVAVDASSNPPEITGIGPDLKLAHVCSGTPRVCRAVTSDGEDEFQLTVEATDVQSGSVLAYEWEYRAPEGVDASAVGVRFEPDSHSRSPLVHIESQGARIAGEWTFTARVTDSIGLVSPAQQKVTIGNAPPRVSVRQSPFVAPHKFQEGYYFANATVVADVHDPEDDEIAEVDLRLVEGSPSGCTFRLVDKALKDGTLGIGFELTAARGQEKQFIGPPRQLALVVHDVNGGETIASVPFEIQNLPPKFHWRQDVPRVEPPAGLGVSGVLPLTHTVESCDLGSCYIARFVDPLEASDPEGDPLDGLEPTADGLDSDSRFSCDVQGCRVATATQQPMKFSGTDGLSPFTLKGHARDPWITSQDEPSARFRLRTNSPPSIEATGAHYMFVHVEADGAYHGTLTVADVFDSEGDHLRLSVSDPDCTVTLDDANPNDFILSCRATTRTGNSCGVRAPWISVADDWSSARILVTFEMTLGLIL